MLQPIVENAIYHGIKPLEDKGKLIVKGIQEGGDNIVFTVWDSGVGMDPSLIRNILSKEAGQRDGFGLGSMNERIKLLYGKDYGISIRSEIGEFTEVKMTIPSVTKFD